MQAHRYAWELAHGPIPDGLCVLHRCDNPPCVNPAHLFLGTRGDNNADRVAKLRDAILFRKGASNPNASLSEEDVRAIRHRRAQGERLAPLAAEFRVAESTISKVARGRYWKHLA